MAVIFLGHYSVGCGETLRTEGATAIGVGRASFGTVVGTFHALSRVAPPVA